MTDIQNQINQLRNVAAGFGNDLDTIARSGLHEATRHDQAKARRERYQAELPSAVESLRGSAKLNLDVAHAKRARLQKELLNRHDAKRVAEVKERIAEEVEATHPSERGALLTRWHERLGADDTALYALRQVAGPYVNKADVTDASTNTQQLLGLRHAFREDRQREEAEVTAAEQNVAVHLRDFKEFEGEAAGVLQRAGIRGSSVIHADEARAAAVGGGADLVNSARADFAPGETFTGSIVATESVV